MKKTFDRVITVMFENQYRSYVIQNPFMKKLAAAGADMTNYFGVFHPSQTNYLASFAGEICGVTNDDPPVSPLMQTTLVDLLEAKGVSWKAYMEGYNNEAWNPIWVDPKYPAQYQPIAQYPPAGGPSLSRYFRKHNAFASFHSVQKDQDRWSKIVDDTQFWKDVVGKNLPQYSWFTPDIWNDGHYLYNTHIDSEPRTQLIPQVANWLEYVFLGNIATSNIQGGSATGLSNLGLNLDIDLLLTDPQKAWENSNVPKGTLIVITFDEADFNAKANDFDTNYDGPNQIYTVLLGDMIKPGTVISTPYNHYGLIKTVQKNYGLSTLHKNDEGANWFRFLWGESFAWGKPMNTGIPPATALAVTQSKGGTHLVFADAKGQLSDCFLTASGAGQSSPLPFSNQGAIAMDSIGKTSYLVMKDATGELMMATYDSETKQWSGISSLNQTTAGSFALSHYFDVANSENKLMLCWVSANGFIQSMEGNGDGFSGNVVPVNQLTDGPMTLSQVGASLFLVYKERNTRKMRMTSYNVAAYNAFSALDFQGNPAPENDTTLHQWSAVDYPVGHFSKKMSAGALYYQNFGNMTMATADGEMHLVHRGGYADMPNAYTEIFGLTGIYSAANQQTNGFGTLNQAGWTLEQEMAEINLAVEGPITMCSDGSTLTLVWADSVTNTIQYQKGGYREH